MDTKTLSRRLTKLEKRSKEFGEEVQTLAVACINQANQHGNTTYLNRLFLALGKGHDRDALGRYIREFAAVKPQTDAAKKADQPFAYSKENEHAGKEFMPEDGVNWLTYATPAKDVERLFDERKTVDTLIKRLKAGAGFKDSAKAAKIGALMEAALAAME